MKANGVKNPGEELLSSENQSARQPEPYEPYPV